MKKKTQMKNQIKKTKNQIQKMKNQMTQLKNQTIKMKKLKMKTLNPPPIQPMKTQKILIMQNLKPLNPEKLNLIRKTKKNYKRAMRMKLEKIILKKGIELYTERKLFSDVTT